MANLIAEVGARTEGQSEHALAVRSMFDRISPTYDLLNRLLSMGIDKSWRKRALALLAEQPSIALLFTDVVMPEMNGKRLADEARALRPDLNILYTTGYTRNAVVHNGMLDAGVAFLAKPFTIAQLAWKVREVLDGAGVNRPV